MTQFDYIIIGGGTSGCVTAWNLVSKYGATVLLLEAGPSDWHPILRIPSGFVKLLGGSRYLRFYESVPQEQLFNRTQIVPQANVLGGGSSVNAQVYQRGRKADWDAWRDYTKDDCWGWDTILPHFVRLEANIKFNNAFHGIDGPQMVSDIAHICEMSHLYVRAVQEMGVPFNPDFNDGAPRGVGYMQVTARNGRRRSVVDSFIAPIRSDKRLTIRTGCAATRILIEKGRAIGVEYSRRGKVSREFARSQVILAAGAFVTPKLLMLSGIGPTQQLSAHGIDTLVDAPGVGANLQDHHEAPVMAQTKRNLGYYKQDVGWRMLLNGLEYVITGRGRASTNGSETCSYLVPDDETGDPIIKLYCVPTTTYKDPDVSGVPDVDGVTLNACLLRPTSRGSVRLRSADPFADPLIDNNFLGNETDLRYQVAGLRAARDVLATAPMAREIVKEIFPGAKVKSDAELSEHARRTVKTNYHPVGTCRVGAEDDPGAVVTADLRVKGVEGLRVFDMSVVPVLMSANTNAPAMAIADRGVELMMSKG
ncbi:GMC family oxidoreductase [Mesorhizobium sp. M3A.F.Ca.ET.201.01.1.1]|nr:GMC family oxidoreductase [Mesorhizobium sp. M3A.F.Ca.ET.201.01.1.1]